MIYRMFRWQKMAGTFPGKVPATFFVGIVAVLALTGGRTDVAAADSMLYRLFLRDGTSIVSYGEFARVADRVVLSIPVGDPAATPTLQLISIPDASVDWERTDRYSRRGAGETVRRDARRERLRDAERAGHRGAQSDCADERSRAASRDGG